MWELSLFFLREGVCIVGRMSSSQLRNANMLTADGLKEIVERKGWWARPPAISLWLLLGASFLLILFGCLSDARVRGSGLWQDEYFLTDSLDPGSKRCAWARQCMQCCSCKSKESKGSPKKASSAAHRELLLSQKPNLSLRFRERLLCQNTLWEVARSCRIHSTCIEKHVWGHKGWVQGSLVTEKSLKLKELVMTLDEGLPSAFLSVHQGRLGRLRLFWTAFLSTQPLYELSMCDLHMTTTKRAKVVMDCLVGSLSFVALFFSVDGTAVGARSPEECPIEQGTFLWYTFVAMLSVLLNLIPRSFECYLACRSFVPESRRHPRLQLWRRSFKDVGFWLFSTGLSLVQLLVVIAFLANLSEKDEPKWMFTFSLVILRKLVIVPLMASLLSGLGTACAIGLTGSPSAPKKFHLDFSLLPSPGANETEVTPISENGPAWADKVQELAGRGITLRHSAL